jgi:hypothetical protein
VAESEHAGMTPDQTPTIGRGFKFPILFIVTRQVEHGETVPDDLGEMIQLSNIRGDKFWAKPLPDGKEILVCFDSCQQRHWFQRTQAIVTLLETIAPYNAA